MIARRRSFTGGPALAVQDVLLQQGEERFHREAYHLLPSVRVISCSSSAASRARDEFRRAATMTRNECERALVLHPAVSTTSEPMLNQVANSIWVRQSAWVLSNAIAVRGEGGLILVDPGIDGSDLNQLADDLERLSIPVVAGFSTHPHWDHLLWHPRFGDVPRCAAGAHAASEARERGQRMAAESASGIPLELIGLVAPLPPRTARPCRARSSSIRRTPSATPRSSSRTGRPARR